MAVLLGGRVAEELVFEEISTGAANDLERVAEMARNMVRQYGMSEPLGPVSYEKQRTTFLRGTDTPWPQEKSYSDETARAMDKEVKRIVLEVKERTRDLLAGDREILDRVAEALLENEVVTREELRDLMDEPVEPESAEQPVGHGGAA